uniref:Uncharacterized protein n=1 Tax=Strongyloides stercoralis TaxID=6248 RepID=A0AAF5DNQ1_STRER
MSERNDMLSSIKNEEKNRLILLLQNKITSDCPKDLSPEENSKRILRNIYKKKVDRYGLIYPFAGEFAITYSTGKFLPFNDGTTFDIHKFYKLDITNSDELSNFDFELSDMAAGKLLDYISGKENPQNSVHYIVQILNKIKYNNKNWTVLYFLYFFLINSHSCKKPCYIIFAITRYTIWIIFFIVANLCTLYVLPNPDKIPYMFRQLVPSQFQERLFHMSREDKKAINEIISKHDKFKDFGDALNALKDKRPNLYNLSMEIKAYIDSKIYTLKPEAKEYVLKRIDEFRKVRPTIEHKYEYLEVLRAIHNTIEDYKKLSEESKTNIAMTFPKIFVYLTSEKFKRLVNGLLEDYESFSS